MSSEYVSVQDQGKVADQQIGLSSYIPALATILFYEAPLQRKGMTIRPVILCHTLVGLCPSRARERWLPYTCIDLINHQNRDEKGFIKYRYLPEHAIFLITNDRAQCSPRSRNTRDRPSYHLILRCTRTSHSRSHWHKDPLPLPSQRILLPALRLTTACLNYLL